MGGNRNSGGALLGGKGGGGGTDKYCTADHVPEASRGAGTVSQTTPLATEGCGLRD